jgi:hypothetical protein
MALTRPLTSPRSGPPVCPPVTLMGPISVQEPSLSIADEAGTPAEPPMAALSPCAPAQASEMRPPGTMPVG